MGDEVLLDDDGPPFLHVFALLRGLNKSEGLAFTCHRMIQNLLNESIHVPSHYEKLRWLALYWNGRVGPPPIVFPNMHNVPR